MAFDLVCSACRARHNSSQYLLTCIRCNGLLDVEYDIPAKLESRVVAGAAGFAKYLPTLPINSEANLVSMGEGNTPIVPLPRLGQVMGLQDLLGKLEFCNPTGSFKDRGNAVQVSVLKETSTTQVADVAVNNAGESCAAYCARAGIRFIGIIGEDSPQLKAWATAFYGTEIQRVKGDRQARFVAAKKFCDANNILFMNYGKNAYFIEGQKTIAYEIVEQMDPVPEHIIMPVGNGSILLGLWLGFREMIEDGRVSRIPRLYGVQAEDVQPLVASFYRQEWVPPPGGSTSIAIGIGITNPPRLEALVQACRRSGGIPVAVADEDIMAWQKRLAQLEGLFVEPTSATVVAAIDKLKRANLIEGSERVLLILTAAGIKEPLTIAGNAWLSKDY